MSDTPKLTKNQVKEKTRERIVNLFEAQSATVESHSAGAVNYLSVSVMDSDQNCAAVYGSRGKAASLWMKEPAWLLLRKSLTDAGIGVSDIKVEDVDLFRRGFQWAVHFDSPDDAHLAWAVDCCVQAGEERWARKQERLKKEQAAKVRRLAKEAEMAEKRRSAWD